MPPSPIHVITHVADAVARLTSLYQKARPSGAPTVTSVSPNFGTDLGGTAVTVVGTNFLGATSVTIGGVACTSVVVVDSAHITCVTPAHASGLCDVSVTTAGGTGTLVAGYNMIFAPTDIANCMAWYRSDLLVTQSGTVSAWGDSSGSGDANRNAVQAAAGLRPTYSASDPNFNNLPSITSGLASGRLLQTGTWSAALPQPYTVFAVCRVLSAVANTYACDGIIGATQSAIYSSVGTDLRTYNGSNSNAAPNFAAAQTGVAIAVMDSPNTATRIYWSEATPSASNNNGTNGLTGVSLGCYGGGGGAFTNTAYAEFAYYSRALTAGEIAKLNTYAGARYGITIGL